ncbi:HAD-IC family P-type ATPase [Fructilactobacillus fructivorans]|uniref:HAD-IC family P-type ATPase n=1 Tax=Fructilactobacillus fructivorans TaxID=1614 RepID=UPI0007051790|nr:HAD-IC family P-type ATPase [Fructilactobacillus fructivorans]KRN42081.1 P-type (transporting) HAD superfamily ATPase [Fructilactobacillus fructivorans]
MADDQINIDDVNPSEGLTTAEVKKQVDDGYKNTEPKPLTKSVKQILVENVFTLFNVINVVLGILVFYTGSYINMLFLVIAIANTAIGIFQEIRSKRQVDKIALLSQSKVKVRRNGENELIQPDQIVLGDIIELDRGDQVPVDGVIKETKGIEVDESQITGESSPIEKNDGNQVTSGSFLVSGKAFMLATKVGDETFVNTITNQAKTDKSKNSVLISLIKKIIKILTIIIIPLGIALFVSRLMHGVSVNNAILGTVAAMIGMIPEGLVLLTSVTLAISAYHLAKKRVLVRDLSSIETLARVNTICLDKTGTITSGELKFNKLIKEAPHYDDQQIAAIMGSLVNEIDDNNETASALKDHFPDHPYSATKIVPFSSARKWSGAELDDKGQYVFGAPQFILNLNDQQQKEVQRYSEQGFRVIALAKVDQLDEDRISGSELIALILITDVIRPNASDTLQYFYNQGVDLKVISGDDPVTVSSIAKRVGIRNYSDYVDMTTIGDDANYQDLVKKYVVFGRVKPDQKQRLIKALQENGRTVAMTGDGVNDLLALKQSDCGIAMASGSESVKSIADFVIIDSNFDALIKVLNEGRRVINNIDSIACLYLIKTMFSVMLSVIFLFFARNYPFQPIQLTPINDLMVGIPSFLLALEPNYRALKDKFVSNIYEISLPAALSVVFYILVIGVIGDILGLYTSITSSLSVLITGVICWLALIMVCRPFNRYKLLIVILSMTLFLSVFIFLGKIFSLVTIFTWSVGGIGLLLALTTDFSFVGIQKCVNLIRHQFFNK